MQARHNTLKAKQIHITGVVQGVGFRPFVYGLAKRHDLRGWVCNSSAGVEIEVCGPAERLQEFCNAITTQAPHLARIESCSVHDIEVQDYPDFSIRRSVALPDEFLPVSADVATCANCRRELFDRHDRRFRYPFINCTQCGPRFTIVTNIPYDRPFTTMAAFHMCPKCAAEYADPASRRFHAQPIACPKCGPKVWLVHKGGPHEDLTLSNLVLPLVQKEGECREKAFLTGRSSDETPICFGEEAIAETRELLKQGKIVAIKGMGGFHLACDATNLASVEELRRRKGRIDKPFALMALDLETIGQYCEISALEERLLVSSQRPIVLLGKRSMSPASRGTARLSPLVAQVQTTLGFMLPYTPLHELLLEPETGFPRTLIMTSGNISEEPIATSNEEALSRLTPLADAFLFHDRDIHIRCDDSVVRVFEDQELPIRRSRGYSPYPVKLPFPLQPILAVGGELKNVFCVARDEYAFLSQHVGDMENYETLVSFEKSVTHFERLFRITPQRISCDIHPHYLATRYAMERGQMERIPVVGVQHHHAHIAACMAENGLAGEKPVIGIAFDGTGYGTDGAIWGGEFLICTYRDFQRVAHLNYVPLPGGDAATRQPYRIALSYLQQAAIEWSPKYACVAAASEKERAVIAHQIRTGMNSPLTSSMGRLFDAVASFLNVRHAVNYEGQAAIELEALSDPGERDTYSPPPWSDQSLKVSSLFPEIAKDLDRGTPVPIIAAKFHNSIAAMILRVAQQLRNDRQLEQVVLSGGVFQNVALLKRTLDLLQDAGFLVYTHRLVPPNDGGIALGQALVASLAGESAAE